jgi:hypothetical protein
MLNSIPEPVDLVGNAFRQVCCALKLELELGHPPGAPRPPRASSRLGRTCAPAGVGHWCTSSGELRRERQYRGDEASIGAESV